MRIPRALFLTTVMCISAVAQDSAGRGVFVGDIDKSADPCTDFFQYSNGAWRSANPIPASMPRWSRRWASGELAKDQLKTILDEVSARKDWKKAASSN